MDTAIFFKGLIIGFSIAAPVGPIGVLCIQRTLTYGRLSGLLTGLGAATADGIYGAVAAFGLTMISGFLVHEQAWLSAIGGAFLFYLGLKTFLSKPTANATKSVHKGFLYDYTSTVILNLTSPATILCFIAIFAGLGLGSANRGLLSATLMTMGVCIGSALWWFILSGGVSLFRKKLKPDFLVMINKISGTILIAFAILAFATIIRK